MGITEPLVSVFELIQITQRKDGKIWGTERNTGDNRLWSDGKSMREMESLWVGSTHMNEQRWVQSAGVSVWLWHKRRKSDQYIFCTRKKKSNYSKWWYCKGDTREQRLEMKVLKFSWCLGTLMVTISVWTHPIATDEYGTSQAGMEASLILKSTSSGWKLDNWNWSGVLKVGIATDE